MIDARHQQLPTCDLNSAQIALIFLLALFRPVRLHISEPPPGGGESKSIYKWLWVIYQLYEHLIFNMKTPALASSLTHSRRTDDYDERKRKNESNFYCRQIHMNPPNAAWRSGAAVGAPKSAHNLCLFPGYVASGRGGSLHSKRCRSHIKHRANISSD